MSKSKLTIKQRLEVCEKKIDALEKKDKQNVKKHNKPCFRCNGDGYTVERQIYITTRKGKVKHKCPECHGTGWKKKGK